MSRALAMAFYDALVEEVGDPADLPESSVALGAANAYRIWREGSAVGWDCTVAELAEATGINLKTVRGHCLLRGWPVKPDDSARSRWMTANHQTLQFVMGRNEAALRDGIRFDNEFEGVWS